MPKVKLGSADLNDNELRGYEVEGQNVLVAKVDGRFKALDDSCNHAGCLLSGGHVQGNLVICPCHEVGFDLDSGANVTSPGVCDDQPTKAVVVEGDELFLEMGDQGHSHSHSHSHAHRELPSSPVSTYVVTCSDSRDASSDQGGPLARRLLEAAGHTVVGHSLVKEEPQALLAALEGAVAAGARAVIFTGGTGLSSRDRTVEVLAPRFDREIPGFGELFRALSFARIGTAAMLSRATGGTYRGASVFLLPGAPDAVQLALERLILPELGHLARELVR